MDATLARRRPRRGATSGAGAHLRSPSGGRVRLVDRPGERLDFVLYRRPPSVSRPDLDVDAADALSLLRASFSGPYARLVALGEASGTGAAGGVLGFISRDARQALVAAACFLRPLDIADADAFFVHVAYLTTAQPHRRKGLARLLLRCLSSSTLTRGVPAGISAAVASERDAWRRLAASSPFVSSDAQLRLIRQRSDAWRPSNCEHVVMPPLAAPSRRDAALRRDANDVLRKMRNGNERRAFHRGSQVSGPGPGPGPLGDALRCRYCDRPDRARVMLVCDGRGCDALWHVDCLAPPLPGVPDGEWFCPSCARARGRGDENDGVSDAEHAANDEPETESGSEMVANGGDDSSSAPVGVRASRGAKRRRTPAPGESDARASSTSSDSSSGSDTSMGAIPAGYRHAIGDVYCAETVSETGRVVRTFGRFNARSGARLSFPDCDEDGGVRVGRHAKRLRSTRAVARWYARAMGIEQGT